MYVKVACMKSFVIEKKKHALVHVSWKKLRS